MLFGVGVLCRILHCLICVLFKCKLKQFNYLGWGREGWFFCYRLLAILLFLFEGVSSWCLAKASLFHYRTPAGSSINYTLRKTIEGYIDSFDFITFEKIISNQSIFVSDKTTNMQFTDHWLRYSTMPNETTLFTEKPQAINFVLHNPQVWTIIHCVSPSVRTSVHS